MPASKANYTAIDATGKTVAAQWPDLHSLLGGWVSLLQSMVRDGVEPDDALRGLILGNTTKVKAWRIYYDSANLLQIQENTGTDAAPVWTLRDQFVFGLGLTLDAARIVSGVLADARISQASVVQHEAALTHDNLIGGAGNKHIDHSLVQVQAGTGLTGGGTIVASRTLSLAVSGVTAATYDTRRDALVVDQYGRITGVASPNEKFRPTDADQSGITSEVAIQFQSPDTLEGHLFPGADGARDYYVVAMVPFVSVTNSAFGQLRLHVGTVGSISDGAVGLPVRFSSTATGWPGSVTGMWRVSNPTSADLVTIGAQRTGGSGTITVDGASFAGYLRIYPASE